MTFIRKRISPTGRRTPSYQVIETYREGGKVKQRVLANLGWFPTVEEASDHCRNSLADTEHGLARLEQLRPRDGGRYALSHGQALDWFRRRIERQREYLRRLDAVVSENGPMGRIPDTTDGSNDAGLLSPCQRHAGVVQRRAPRSSP